MTHRFRVAALCALFGIQLAGIAYARFAPTRFVAWAPYDQISFYRIEVERDGRALTPSEVAARYRMPEVGRENRAIEHVLQAVAQYEATYGRRDLVRVRVSYRVNQGSETTWRLPK